MNMDELRTDCVLFVYYLFIIDVLLYDDENLKKSSSLIQTTISLTHKKEGINPSLLFLIIVYFITTFPLFS